MLGRGQEFARLNQLAVAIAQAEQNFAAEASADSLQRLDLLGEQREMVLGNRLIEQMHPGGLRASRLDRTVDVEIRDHAVPARFLGGIASRIGGLQKLVRIFPGPIDRHQADRSADAEFPAVMGEALLVHAVADLVGDIPRAGHVAMFEDDAEFVAAESGQGIA